MNRIYLWLSMSALVTAAGFQLSAGQWLTFGGNPQRDGWARDETALSKENVKSIKVIWKRKIDSAPKELNSLTAPIIVENVLTAQGHKDIILVGGGSDTLDAVDADTGKVLWHKTFQAEGTPRQTPRWLCPNALNATPVIQQGGDFPRDKTVHVIASDGKLHSLNVVNGEDRKPPIAFVPPFSKNWSLNLVNGVLYTATSQGCNGAKSAVYAMNLKDPKRPVTFFQASTAGAGIWGRAGVAVGPDGTVYAETGDGPFDPASEKYSDTILALTPGDLKLKDFYAPPNTTWINRKDLDFGCMSPTVFKYKQWELIAVSGKEGRVFLLDAKSLGGPAHSAALYRSPIYTNEDLYSGGRGFWGAFATWEDAHAARWLYLPAWGPLASKAEPFPVSNGPSPDGSIMAFKVDEKDGKPFLTPAWMSRNMNVPEPPIIANGLIFVVSNGENVMQADSEGRLMSSKQRLDTAPGHAILYALDAETGKELYNSGDAISGITHFSGIAMSNGRIYVAGFDSTLYSFGLEEQ
jgi:outer membrane protein assembly factor BamB